MSTRWQDDWEGFTGQHVNYLYTLAHGTGLEITWGDKSAKVEWGWQWDPGGLPSCHAGNRLYIVARVRVNRFPCLIFSILVHKHAQYVQ